MGHTLQELGYEITCKSDISKAMSLNDLVPTWGASSTTHHQLAGGGDCPALLCTGAASPQALRAVWGPTTQERHKGVRVSKRRARNRLKALEGKL